jgi:hypothetical protein
MDHDYCVKLLDENLNLLRRKTRYTRCYKEVVLETGVV